LFQVLHPSSRAARPLANISRSLNAYYIYIHSYFPILPPPHSPVTVDTPLSHRSVDFEPSSPVSLAISAILALIPHPADQRPQGQSSVRHRRKHAELFSQLAMESIEIESEVLVSATSPAEALSGVPTAFRREPFHPQTPIELESILAFLLLSGYEYAQRGNLVKMRNRASQAVDAATRLGLHQEMYSAVRDEYTEARRRAWWMTYVCALQASIVSNTVSAHLIYTNGSLTGLLIKLQSPIITIEHTRFSTPFPSNAFDYSAWNTFLDAQQIILKCSQFTVSLNAALQAGSDLSSLQDAMLVLDSELDSINSKYSWESDVTSGLLADFEESILARSLKAQAKIKLVCKTVSSLACTT
jgi:hypothetical protein